MVNEWIYVEATWADGRSDEWMGARMNRQD